MGQTSLQVSWLLIFVFALRNQRSFFLVFENGHHRHEPENRKGCQMKCSIFRRSLLDSVVREHSPGLLRLPGCES
uniref:Putative secreted peptide n=1 Tax=Anopheles braziliensis TaxID=58242 RepID=A0A2M3ZWM6_9DIPT